MRTTLSHLAVLLALLPVASFAGDVQVFPAKGVDLGLYKTYRILPTRVLTKSGVQENDPDLSPIIVAAINNELAKKGLREASEGADLEVSVGALAVSIPQVEAFIYNINMDAAFGTSPLVTLGRYNKEGTLIVNLIDPSTKKSVWLGFAKRALGKPSNRAKDVDKAAQALFKKYPSVK